VERAKRRAMRVHSADEADITGDQGVLSAFLGLLTEHDDH